MVPLVFVCGSSGDRVVLRLILLAGISALAGCKVGRQLPRGDVDAADDRGSTPVPGSGGSTDTGGRGATGGTIAGGGGAIGTGGTADAGSPIGTGGRTGAGGTGGAGGTIGAGGRAGAAGAIGSGGGTGTGGAPGTGGSSTGLRPASLSANAMQASLGNVEVGITAPTSVIISNGGDVPTSVPTLTNSNPTELTVVTNGCTGAIAGGAGCTIALGFRPSTGGSRTGSVTLSVTGSAVTFNVVATGAYRVTVTKAGTGTGTVTTVPAGINCGTTCSALFAGGAPVTVQARTTNGSNAFFSGYAGGGCSGPGRDCTIPGISAQATITATFSPMTNNLIFISSPSFPSNRGGASFYDSNCNAAATAAGINDAAGTAYIAMISDAASAGVTRLGSSARGWVRMDGLPFADTQTSLFANNVVFNSVRYDENGNRLPFGTIAMTGTNVRGESAGFDCLSWTSSLPGPGPGNLGKEAGSAEGGSMAWVDAFPAGGCDFLVPLLCMGKTHTAPVAAAVTAGRKVWVSNSTVTLGGGVTPDQTCQSQLPAGVTTAMALIATTTRTAASVLNMTGNYVRPDGTLVGNGALIATGQGLLSGIWQLGNLQYATTAVNQVSVWIGATSPTALGTTASTCGNWTDPTQIGGLYGLDIYADLSWWGAQPAACNAGPLQVYCVQTAP